MQALATLVAVPRRHIFSLVDWPPVRRAARDYRADSMAHPSLVCLSTLLADGRAALSRKGSAHLAPTFISVTLTNSRERARSVALRYMGTQSPLRPPLGERSRSSAPRIRPRWHRLVCRVSESASESPRSLANGSLREELEKAATGLTYSSESDYPFQFFTLPAEGENDLTPQGFLNRIGVSQQFIDEINLPIGQLIEERKLAGFFRNRR